MAQTVTHPPATISGNINCPQTGDNGDCTAAASLSLSGNEPLSGYHITDLEGTRNGDAFLCEGSSCTISLLEGANAFTFWALSDWGDSSEMGSANRAVDTRSPSVSASASGTPGSGSWFVSAVTIEASASDPSPGSGLASFQAAVDGSWGAYSGTITLNDGSHTVELLATDNAGLNDSASMSFQIDTIAPTTVFTDPTGTSWATGTIALSGVSSDLNLAGTEISYNGGSSWTSLSPDSGGNWSTNWNTHTVANGSYSVRARGRDQAGNVGGADSVTIMVDNGEPLIYIPASWPIWQRVSINVVDNGIGVERVRLTIHGGSYGERVYNWNSGQDDFKWDRYFDGVSAPIGGYPVEVEAWDRVGNKGAAWGEIVIPAPVEVEQEDDPGVLSIAPPDDPPSEPPGDTGGGDTGGGDTAPAAEEPPAAPSVVTFGSEPQTESEEIAPPADSSNVLWGAAAVAAVGAAMIVVTAAKKKRKEEEKKQAAAAAIFNKTQIALEEKQAQNAAQRKWEAEQEAALRAEIKAEREAQGIRTDQPAPIRFLYVEAQKQIQRIKDLVKRIEIMKQERERAQRDAFRQIDNVLYQDYVAEQEKSWWDKTVDWVDEHQRIIAIGVGVVVGAAIVIASAGAAIPLVVGGIALVGGGTVALNHHYDRPLTQNLVGNLVLGGIGSFVCYGVAFVIDAGGLGTALLKAGNNVGSFCAAHPTLCKAAGGFLKVFDTVEEGYLKIKLAYQEATGDRPGALETMNELYMESLDFGVPGNATANEVMDLIQSSSDEVMDLVQHHGDDLLGIIYTHRDEAIELLEKYSDEAAEILAKYQDEGFDWLNTYGEPVIDLIDEYGDNAAEILTLYGDDGFNLLSMYGEDAIDLIGLYGDDAAEILTQYGDDGLVLLSTHGDDSIVVLNNLQTTIDEQALSGIVDQDQITQTASAILNNSNDVIPLDNPDVLGYFLKTGPEGVEYVSNYSNNVDDVLKTVEAISAAEQLSIIGSNSDEARELIDTIVDASTHGTGDKVVIGQWVEDGYGYIEYASDTEGIFFDTPPGLYDATGSQRSIMEEINQEFLRKQLEDGIPTIELFNETIEEVRLNRPDSFTCMELDFLEEVAPQYGYTLVDNAWVLVE